MPSFKAWRMPEGYLLLLILILLLIESVDHDQEEDQDHEHEGIARIDTSSCSPTAWRPFTFLLQWTWGIT